MTSDRSVPGKLKKRRKRLFWKVSGLWEASQKVRRGPGSIKKLCGSPRVSYSNHFLSKRRGSSAFCSGDLLRGATSLNLPNMETVEMASVDSQNQRSDPRVLSSNVVDGPNPKENSTQAELAEPCKHHKMEHRCFYVGVICGPFGTITILAWILLSVLGYKLIMKGDKGEGT